MVVQVVVATITRHQELKKHDAITWESRMYHVIGRVLLTGRSKYNYSRRGSNMDKVLRSKLASTYSSRTITLPKLELSTILPFSSL